MAIPGSIDAWVEEELDAYFTIPTVGQTKRVRAMVKIWVNGLDVTDRLDPYLISVKVKNGGYWIANIELDDRDGRLPIPPFQSELIIQIGWVGEQLSTVFDGWILDVQHAFGRRLGGRRMFIEANGAKQSAAIKTPMQDHVGEGAPPGMMEGNMIAFGTALQQFAGNVGMGARVGMSFKDVMRDYWSIDNSSVGQWASEYADDLGGWTRIEGDTIVFYGRGDIDAPGVIAQWGNNLISWRIHPYTSRSLWGGASQQFFDHVKGLWGEASSQFDLPTPWGGTWANAITKLPMPAAHSSAANQYNQGQHGKASWESGWGRIIINGEPSASWFSEVQLIGARPGVDGMYVARTVTHTWSRQGYVTTLEVMPDTLATTNNIGSVGYGLSNQAYTITRALEIAQATNEQQQVPNADGSYYTVYPDGMVTLTNATGTQLIDGPNPPPNQ